MLTHYKKKLKQYRIMKGKKNQKVCFCTYFQVEDFSETLENFCRVIFFFQG